MARCSRKITQINRQNIKSRKTSQRTKPEMKIKEIVILFFVVAAASCNNASHALYYQVPEQTEDGLQVAALEQVGLDTSLIIKAVDRIRRGKFGEIHSILIYKEHKLVLEEYFPGHQYQWDAKNHKGKFITWNKETPHALQSASKSFISICIGIAIEKGFIKSVEQAEIHLTAITTSKFPEKTWGQLDMATPGGPSNTLNQVACFVPLDGEDRKLSSYPNLIRQSYLPGLITNPR